ncbi:hypothetical protein Agub_g10817 [Astrephomene gubernaculifera]|uniref:Uncharacterized protein n=1 Tax=Astrephomene gubernaculifera TaxID=47775 RepID=A0AAD3DYC2_9CHLO|nr:hypothetical protein Agub_g10817 [Astrephomene gubernaculifera]
MNPRTVTLHFATTLLWLWILVPYGRCKLRKEYHPPGYRNVAINELLELAQVPTSDSIISFSDNKETASSILPDQPSHLEQSQQLSDSDFVFATGSCRERMRLAKSTRAWRRGIRGFILTDQNETQALLRLNADGKPHNESFAFFPNDGDPLLGMARHGTMQGDTRAALAPFAAHRHYGDTYKWMLYGDDDTLFFMDAVKRLLASFDPDLPLAFSDNLWYLGAHPNPHAPRCLPCHLAGESLPSLKDILSTHYARAALRKQLAAAKQPTSEAALEAAAADPTQVPGRRYMPQPACPYCTPQAACAPITSAKTECKASVPHGGAGMIFSVGLLRMLPYPTALACLRSFEEASGGDFMVANCLWRHGIAFTDPGPLVRHLYDPHFVTFGAHFGQGYLWDPMGMLTHGRCNATCRWMLRNTLSLHIKGRHFKNWRVSAMHMWGVAHAAQAAKSFLDLLATGSGNTSVPRQHVPYGADLETDTVLLPRSKNQR